MLTGLIHNSVAVRMFNPTGLESYYPFHLIGDVEYLKINEKFL